MSLGDAIASHYAERAIKAVLALVVFLAASLFLTWRWQPWSLRDDIDRLERRVQSLEGQK